MRSAGVKYAVFGLAYPGFNSLTLEKCTRSLNLKEGLSIAFMIRDLVGNHAPVSVTFRKSVCTVCIVYQHLDHIRTLVL